MADQNPFQTPETMATEIYEEREQIELADRGIRLVAVILESFIGIFLILPIFFIFGFSTEEILETINTVGIVYVFAVLIGLVSVNIYLLVVNQQTIGKKIMKIKIVRKDFSRCSFWRIFLLRGLLVGFIGVLPCVGYIFSLVDPLMLFRESRYCLHDDIADTVVVNC